MNPSEPRTNSHNHKVPLTKCPACDRSFLKLTQQVAQIAKMFPELGDDATDAELIAAGLVQLAYAVNTLTHQLERGAR